MAVWIKMSLGMEVGLGPGDFVLDDVDVDVDVVKWRAQAKASMPASYIAKYNY